MTEPQQPQEEPRVDVRGFLMGAIQKARSQPNLAQAIYKQLGIDHQDVRLNGYQAPMHELQPGDLVGWRGGNHDDGTYTGNIAVYAGNNEIIERFFETVRRRKLSADEDTFGMPVVSTQEPMQEM